MRSRQVDVVSMTQAASDDVEYLREEVPTESSDAVHRQFLKQLGRCECGGPLVGEDGVFMGLTTSCSAFGALLTLPTSRVLTTLSVDSVCLPPNAHVGVWTTPYRLPKASLGRWSEAHCGGGSGCTHFMS